MDVILPSDAQVYINLLANITAKDAGYAYMGIIICKITTLSTMVDHPMHNFILYISVHNGHHHDLSAQKCNYTATSRRTTNSVKDSISSLTAVFWLLYDALGLRK